VPKCRPREFDTEGALDDALEVFWRKGYEGARLRNDARSDDGAASPAVTTPCSSMSAMVGAASRKSVGRTGPASMRRARDAKVTTRRGLPPAGAPSANSVAIAPPSHEAASLWPRQ
jgi:hypothetical protein